MCHPTRNSGYYSPLSSRVSREAVKSARIAEAVEAARGRLASSVIREARGRISATEQRVVRKVISGNGMALITDHPLNR